jgi:hypothetical protein
LPSNLKKIVKVFIVIVTPFQLVRGLGVGTAGGQYYTNTDSKGMLEVQKRKKKMEKNIEDNLKGKSKGGKTKSRGYEERKDGDTGSK